MALTVESRSKAGARLAELVDADIESYSYRLNAPGALRFSLPAERLVDESGARTVRIRDVLDPDRGHEIWLQRDGQTVWAGPLLTVDEQPDRISFGAEGLLAYTRQMFVTSTLETADYPDPDPDDPASGPIPGATIISRDQHEIVKALIDHHQSKPGGDFAIDTSTVEPSGRLRDRQYKGWEVGNVYDLISNITELTSAQGGCDVWIDPATRRLRLATPSRGRRRTATVFNDRNVRRFSRKLDKTRLASQVIGIGAGEGQDMLRIARTSGAAVSRVGLLQHVHVNKQVSRHATLTDQVDAELRDRDTLPNLIEVTVATDDPPVGSYDVGDEVRIHFDSPFEFVDVFRRIVQVEVRPAGRDGGEETAVLSLERLGVG